MQILFFIFLPRCVPSRFIVSFANRSSVSPSPYVITLLTRWISTSPGSSLLWRGRARAGENHLKFVFSFKRQCLYTLLYRIEWVDRLFLGVCLWGGWWCCGSARPPAGLRCCCENKRSILLLRCVDVGLSSIPAVNSILDFLHCFNSVSFNGSHLLFVSLLLLLSLRVA